MAAAINLQELEQELTRTKSMFEQWSAAMLSRAQGCKSAHTSQLLASKGEPRYAVSMKLYCDDYMLTLVCMAVCRGDEHSPGTISAC
jgi:hypothetical protein